MISIPFGPRTEADRLGRLFGSRVGVQSAYDVTTRSKNPLRRELGIPDGNDNEWTSDPAAFSDAQNKFKRKVSDLLWSESARSENPLVWLASITEGARTMANTSFKNTLQKARDNKDDGEEWPETKMYVEP